MWLFVSAHVCERDLRVQVCINACVLKGESVRVNVFVYVRTRVCVCAVGVCVCVSLCIFVFL